MQGHQRVHSCPALVSVFMTMMVLLPGVTAQVVGQGRCPNATAVQQFDLTRYLGGWYEIERFFHIFEVGLECVTANYTDNSDGTVSVVNSGTYALFGTKTSARGTAAVPDPSEPARIAVTFIPGMRPRTVNYVVLDTDYDTYSLVYNCEDYYLFKSEFAWILSRTRSLDQQRIEGLHEKLSGLTIDPAKFSRIRQNDC